MPTTSPLCQYCAHVDDDDAGKCAAFPDGIPDAIMQRGEADEHRKPFKGDGGIRFKPDSALVTQILTGKTTKAIAWRVLG